MSPAPTPPPPAPGLLRRALTSLVLSGACPAWLAAALLARIRDDVVWAAHYEAVRRVERAMSRDSAISPAQIDLVESLVLANIGKAEPVRRRLRDKLAVASLFPAGALAGVLIMIAAQATTTTPKSEWRERGVAGAPHLGVRARCVDAAARRVVGQAEAGPRMLDDTLACPHGDLLSVSLTNLEERPFYVFVVGVNAGGDLRFISPFSESSASRVAAAGVVDEPLDVVADTSSLPADDGVTLFALFSSTPLHGADIARALRDARARGVSVHALARLPFDAYTARIELSPSSPREAPGEQR